MTWLLLARKIDIFFFFVGVAYFLYIYLERLVFREAT